MLKSFILYFSLLAALLAWWLFFLTPTSQKLSCPSIDPDKPYLPFSPLTSLKREDLHQALSGNLMLATSLMTKWEDEALELEKLGVPNIHHLPDATFRKAQLFGSLLAQTNQKQLLHWNAVYQKKSVADDNGIKVTLDPPLQRFLPQTYQASTFLLALIPPEKIVAIPGGLRDTPRLYNPELLKKIPIDIDRNQSEKIYRLKADIAYIAEFSNPATVQALKNQGIPLFTIKQLDSFEDIGSAIVRIGHTAGSPIAAELLAAFMEAAFIAIDNRIAWLNRQFIDLPPQKVLYLHQHHGYMLPTVKSLAGKLLLRFNALSNRFTIHVADDLQSWKLPIEREEILNTSSDCLLISTTSGNRGKDPFLSLHFKRNGCIDDLVQETPTQYIVLGYFDIFNALLSAYRP